MITDPKAIQYVYHTASYRFPKPTGRSAIIRSLFGPGLTVMEGKVAGSNERSLLSLIELF